MAYERTEAVVLRKVDFSETSRIVTFLTPDRGRMACMARGARRKGSPLAAALDTFNRCELTYAWRDSRQVQNLIEAHVIDGFELVKRDVLRMAAASFVLETALHAAHENNPAPELYDALVSGLSCMATSAVAPLTCAAQSVYGLLQAAGHAPDGDEEGQFLCMRALTTPERAEVKQALVRMAAGKPLPQDHEPGRLLRFLHEYAANQFETGYKSFAFLRSLF